MNGDRESERCGINRKESKTLISTHIELTINLSQYGHKYFFLSITFLSSSVSQFSILYVFVLILAKTKGVSPLRLPTIFLIFS